MQLRNQMDNKNLISKITSFSKELQKSGKSPEQIYNEMISSGKYSKEQIDKAKQWADSMVGIFSH